MLNLSTDRISIQSNSKFLLTDKYFSRLVPTNPFAPVKLIFIYKQFSLSHSIYIPVESCSKYMFFTTQHHLFKSVDGWNFTYDDDEDEGRKHQGGSNTYKVVIQFNACGSRDETHTNT